MNYSHAISNVYIEQFIERLSDELLAPLMIYTPRKQLSPKCVGVYYHVIGIPVRFSSCDSSYRFT